MTTDSEGYPNSTPSATDKFAPPRLRRVEASDYLRERYGLSVAPGTLAKLVTTGGGPRFNKAGRFPLYPKDELDAWARARLGPVVASTTELDAVA